MNVHFNHFIQAYNLSEDHKPDLQVEKERIYKAGGYIHFGRVNGSLNLARAIGISHLLILLLFVKLALFVFTTNTEFYFYHFFQVTWS